MPLCPSKLNQQRTSISSQPVPPPAKDKKGLNPTLLKAPNENFNEMQMNFGAGNITLQINDTTITALQCETHGCSDDKCELSATENWPGTSLKLIGAEF